MVRTCLSEFQAAEQKSENLCYCFNIFSLKAVVVILNRSSADGPMRLESRRGLVARGWTSEACQVGPHVSPRVAR